MKARHLTILFFLSAFICNGQGVSSAELLITEMLSSIKKVQTLKYDFKATERIDGVIGATNYKVKLGTAPFQLYLYKKESGEEVLYSEGVNNNEIIVNPNGFPYVNLNLDPFGSLMRKGAHHTIFESGFAYLGGIIEQSIKNSNKELYRYISYDGEINWANRICYKVTMDYTPFKYYSYEVTKNESLTSLARRLNLSEYMIAEKNNISVLDEVESGSKLLLPNLYAKKIILYIDKVNRLPINMMIYDDKGFFEGYEFYSLHVNPEMKKNEFSKDFKEYKF